MTSSKNLEMLISREQIAEAVKRMAHQIEGDYPTEMPLLVAVLKGSFIFLADLVRQMQRPVELDFLRLSSYGNDVESSGKVRLRMGVTSPVRGRDVLVVEDIVDTGLTTSYASRYLRRKGASSVRLCTLLDKPSRRQVPVTLDYMGFTLPDEFVVGYGLDFDEQYRHLPDIHILTGVGHEP
ncbi:MAG: hypoxanthine phosphoribosyltransferase [Chloroflexota bacterium]